MGATNYKELDMWQRGMDLCEEVYRVSKDFPKEELYGLVSQMRRSAVSISGNIAEGFARKSNPDFRRFLTIAKGSLIELETYIELSKRFHYLPNETTSNLLEMTTIIGKMITKFVQNMR